VGILEQLQVPLAQVRDALGIPGMDEESARNVREKARMKTVLGRAGVPCARHRLVTRTEDALDFLRLVGLPVVAKPPDGAGAVATFRLDTAADVDAWLEMARAQSGQAWLLEEFLTGREHTFDSVTIEGETVFSSIADYHPTPLEVLRNPWVQWQVVLPQAIDGPEYREIHRVGPAALSALGVRTSLTHMEWFARPDGSVAISEVGARPPGAQLASMIGLAHDVDFFDLWARLMILEEFRPPRRSWACGTAYLRGLGRGRVRAVHGLDEVWRDLGDLVVDSRLPRVGAPSSTGYEGEGFITVRHRDTDAVRDALARIVSRVRVELVEAG
jgi:biotin carboxylase